MEANGNSTKNGGAGFGEALRFFHARGVLELLLLDRATRGNIVWATDAYNDLGLGFLAKDGISAGVLTGAPGFELLPRAAKTAATKSSRTKSHAEVFTPLPVCRKMIAALPLPAENTEAFLDATCLELACGEAPFLVQRHDPATAAPIGVPDRGGLLDRKLRAAATLAGGDPAAYPALALRALRSTYAFELQGDSLLIARLSAMLAVLETHRAFFPGAPELDDAFLRDAASAVAWNFFQMDALTGRVPEAEGAGGGADGKPNSDAAKDAFPALPIGIQFTGSLLGDPETPETPLQPPALVALWQQRQAAPLFAQILNRKEPSMKFDYIIGNPPYQEETAQGTSETNGQAPRKNIFHFFQMATDSVCKRSSVLIYPAGRWLHRSGKGLEQFGLQQINDPKLKTVLFFPHTRDLFKEVDIADGLGIVVKDMDKKSHDFKYVYVTGEEQTSVTIQSPGDDLIPLNPGDLSITEKAAKFMQTRELPSLHERILPRTLFGIESNFVHEHPKDAIPLENVQHIDYSKQVKLLTNDKAGKAGRAKWFVVNRSSIPSNQDFIDEWQVVVSSANAGGQKRDSQLEIIDNHSAFGRVRVALASFKTLGEARNFYAYVSTFICRFLFLMTDEALTSLGKKVPDLIDYTQENPMIDFAGDLDGQLAKLMGLSEENVEHLQSVVKNLRNSDNRSESCL